MRGKRQGRQPRAVVHGAVSGVVIGEVQPPPVGADEAVGIIKGGSHDPCGAVGVGPRLVYERALIRPVPAAVKADPEGKRHALLRIGIVQ